jgi:dTDP-4-dehydrorhamnose reductase
MQDSKKVLILGGDGMLGYRVWKTLIKEPNLQVAQTTRKSTQSFSGFPEQYLRGLHTGISATNYIAINQVIAQEKPEFIINCIGVVKQRKDADLQEQYHINGFLPHYFSSICELIGAKLIHFSTDCVFSGNSGNYSELDNPDPLDVYGRTKLLGEVVEQKNALTLRTSIIGREKFNKMGLVEWYLSNAKNSSVGGYHNAIFSGLTTLELSKLIVQIINRSVFLNGLYHVAAEPINKFDILGLFNTYYGLDLKIEAQENPRINRSLSAARFNETLMYTPPSWNDMIRDMVNADEQ